MRQWLRGAMALALGLTVSGTGTPHAAAAGAAPLRASFEVAMSLTPDVACGGFRVTGTGSGWATQMGRSTISVEECVDFAMESGRVHVYGLLVLTAADGDQLRVAVDKVGDVPGASGQGHVAGPFVVTGGTGRFAGISGSGTTTTDADLVTSTATAELAGTLRRR